MTKDSDGNTPLHFAALDGQYETVKFCISELNCDPNTPGQWGMTPLHIAAEGGSLETVKWLIEEQQCNPASFGQLKSYSTTLCHS